MKNQNSCAEYVLGTYGALLEDCALHYPALAKEFKRDFVRLSSAIEKHGVRFALDVLPSWRKHFDQCLAKKRLTPTHMCHFGPYKKGGSIPKLFRGLVLRVFDSSGVLKSDPDVQAIRDLRQLLGAVRKMRMECNVSDRVKTVQDFIKIDAEVREPTFDWRSTHGFDHVQHDSVSFEEMSRVEGTVVEIFDDLPQQATLPYELARNLQRVADYFCSKLGHFDPAEWRFKHGPGSVADRRFGSYKYDFDQWPDRLEDVFPYADFACANYAMAIPPLHTGQSDGVAIRKEHPAVLHAVPKTISGPRLIASEPVALQWCQQAIRDYLYTRVSESTISNFVDFRRQGLNGELALEASRSGQHATIDLSSASDRISCWHVERLFRRSPSLLNALRATRSLWLKQEIDRKSPKYMYLRKYSTMGNATTFPVQSLFFLTIAIACLITKRKYPDGVRRIPLLGKREVRVFGDDIIVPEDCARLVIDTLHALGLRVNDHKTFVEGNFRESCGIDAFAGHDVTCANVLDVPSRAKPGSIVSSVDAHNNLCEKGYMRAAAYIQRTVARLVSNKIRFKAHGSGSFGWSDLFGTRPTSVKLRYNHELHRQEARCLRTHVHQARAVAEGSPALLQYFTEAPKVVTAATSSLGYLEQRPKTKLVLGWDAL